MGHAASIHGGDSEGRGSGKFLDPAWQLEGEWRSERAKELDKVAGSQRMALKKGESLNYKLETLEVSSVYVGCTRIP